MIMVMYAVGLTLGCSTVVALRNVSPAGSSSTKLVTDSVSVGGQGYRVAWLYDESFDDPAALESWKIESEGPAVYVGGGALQVRRNESPRLQSGVTLWLDLDLPKDCLVEVEAFTLPGEHACNLNFFLNAREADATTLQYTRHGVYTSYHTIPNYLFTFTEGWARARKNPGFELLREVAELRSEPGRRYRFVMVLEGDRLRYCIDGMLIHDLRDPMPLPPGRFGLRTWFSNIDYERVRIGRIVPHDFRRSVKGEGTR